jgi:hypothetical protein
VRIFTLDVEPHPEPGAVGFTLLDGDGTHVAAHQVRLADHSGWRWQGLFSTRDHVRRYAGTLRDADGRKRTAEELLAEIGLFLGQDVLGDEVTAALADGNDHRTLLVRLPDGRESGLAASMGRVPWEIARPGSGEAPLMARGLVVRAVPHGATDCGEQVIDREPEEAVRVLLVFAQAQGSQPLALRRELQQLLQLLHDEVAPHRDFAVDLLCHGITREGLTEQFRSARGYHIVHWSGHGHHDLLELESETGEPALLSGEALVELIEDAGGFIPRLFFLSACHSGSMIRVKDWASLHALLGRRDATREGDDPPLARILDEKIGYTGTALQLLEAGVPQVVAMRYEVGDAYARRLARRFYKALLADAELKAADSALYLARKDLLGEERADLHPVDHATPLIFGAARILVRPEERPSRRLDRLWPRPVARRQQPAARPQMIETADAERRTPAPDPVARRPSPVVYPWRLSPSLAKPLSPAA